jgi:prepilin-type N-terminal cleavage/methylation domain-containing protein
MDPAMPRRAFTLLELLVVISIIAALAALLVPIISIARAAAKTAKCRTLMAQISAALDTYKSASGSYPEQTWATLASDPIATAFGVSSGAAASTPPTPVLQVSEASWQSVSYTLKGLLQTVDPDTFRNTPSNPNASYNAANPDPGYLIVDPFGNRQQFKVIRYRPARFYPFAGTPSGNNPTIDTANPPNPNSYQLWSCGPDGKDEYGEKVWTTTSGQALKGDDLTNWSNN